MSSEGNTARLATLVCDFLADPSSMDPHDLVRPALAVTAYRRLRLVDAHQTLASLAHHPAAHGQGSRVGVKVAAAQPQQLRAAQPGRDRDRSRGVLRGSGGRVAEVVG